MLKDAIVDILERKDDKWHDVDSLVLDLEDNDVFVEYAEVREALDALVAEGRIHTERMGGHRMWSV
jgi:Fe2+ or Zn2+ uptake regulation protein